MKLNQLMKVVYDCYIFIQLENSKNERVIAFDDETERDGPEKLKRVIKEFGDCEVIYVSSSENYLCIVVSTEYEEV